MKRRDLLSALPFTGYSLYVFASPGQAAQSPALPVTAPRFEVIAPPSARRGALAAEPNMSLVEIQADVCIAGGGLAGICEIGRAHV